MLRGICVGDLNHNILKLHSRARIVVAGMTIALQVPQLLRTVIVYIGPLVDGPKVDVDKGPQVDGPCIYRTSGGWDLSGSDLSGVFFF